MDRTGMSIFWRGTKLALVVAMTGLAVALPGQDSFAERFAVAERLPVTEVAGRQAAFATAFQAFRAEEVGSRPYLIGLPNAARAALYSGSLPEAIELFAALGKAGLRDDAALQLELSALLRGGRGTDTLRLAQELAATHRAGLQTWLRGYVSWLPRTSDFSRIAALGGAELRAGRGDGLWLLKAQDEAMAELPGRYFSRANLALAYRLLGRFRDAGAAYAEAIREAPNESWLRNDRGLLLKGQGRYDEAAAAYLKALAAEAKPGSGAAGTNLAVLFLRTGKLRGRDPVADTLQIVKARPEAAMPRRLLLSLLARSKSR